MSSEEHISYFKIENFKRFESLEVQNIGQFNLIVGDNNVGKSSLLEALLFEGDVIDFLANLLTGFIQKYDINFFSSFIEQVHRNGIFEYIKLFFNRKLSSEEINISMKTNLERNYTLKFKDRTPTNQVNILYPNLPVFGGGITIQPISQKQIILQINSNSQEIDLDPNFIISKIQNHYYIMDEKSLIPFSFNNQRTVATLYNKVISRNKMLKKEILQNLKILVPDIEDIQLSLHGNQFPNLEIIQTDSNTPIPLSSIGDGANKIFRILVEIAARKNKRLMIDEIDTGIHYSRLKSFWSSVLSFADAYNVQIFATSHNIECLQYFKKTLEESNMQKYQERARILSIKDIQGKPKVYTYTFPEFQACIDSSLEMR